MDFIVNQNKTDDFAYAGYIYRRIDWPEAEAIYPGCSPQYDIFISDNPSKAIDYVLYLIEPEFRDIGVIMMDPRCVYALKINRDSLSNCKCLVYRHGPSKWSYIDEP